MAARVSAWRSPRTILTALARVKVSSPVAGRLGSFWMRTYRELRFKLKESELPRERPWRFCVAAAGSALRYMGRSEEYRQFGEACLEMAQTAADQVARAMLIEMARVWHRLADAHAYEPDEVGELDES